MVTIAFGALNYTPILTPECFCDLLEWCPVGTDDERNMWLGHMSVIQGCAAVEQGFHGLLDEQQRSIFSHARDWARENGLPVFKQKQAAGEGVWGTVVHYLTKLKPSERQPLIEAPNIAMMTGSEILSLIDIVRKTPYQQVPEPRLEVLLAKYYFERETTGQGHSSIQEMLLNLFNNDPLRLYSRLGLRFFMGEFLNQTRTHQASIVSTVLMAGTSNTPDARVLPIFRNIIEKTSEAVLREIFKPEYVMALIRVVQKYPSLRDLLPIIQKKCPELFLEEHVDALLKLVVARPELAVFVAEIFKNQPELLGARNHKMQLMRLALQESGAAGVLILKQMGSEFITSCLEMLVDEKGRLIERFSNVNPVRVLWSVLGTKDAQRTLEEFWQEQACTDTECHWKEYYLLRCVHPGQVSIFYDELSPDDILEQTPTWQQLATPVLLDMLMALDNAGKSVLHQARAMTVQEYLKKHRRGDFSKPLPAVFDDALCLESQSIINLKRFFRFGF